ncbi:hypothetical protein AVEN_154996-1 [Araneus ventricosus]|uniref:Integrase catalytic domain-containing protein n=1 Tax=Araneus ventricosus TaxID=182803 RepID=A0A4Y2A8X4_ARAVE|nr:hypothetical protein AVEN_154996-1 [Araneus ventricosus]
MDNFMKWPVVYALHHQEATTVAEVLLQNWISRFETSLQFHSDQGRNFTSCVCKGLCQLLKIDKTQTSPLHPQSDSMVNIFNRTILNNLSISVSKSQRDWDWKVPFFLSYFALGIYGYSCSPILSKTNPKRTNYH